MCAESIEFPEILGGGGGGVGIVSVQRWGGR